MNSRMWVRDLMSLPCRRAVAQSPPVCVYEGSSYAIIGFDIFLELHGEMNGTEPMEPHKTHGAAFQCQHHFCLLLMRGSSSTHRLCSRRSMPGPALSIPLLSV
ncbi:hypothetical protein TNIN_486601 [Trichonephila inaurata madagascariensis]|uniref:Uncharacterized protein n=1 Tax=Trichonephila inaurata madagascariensis TaxID=2747483 RepID=A0A8X6Y9N5_9ARAC|nr:hypothetical protein TNIN_486601 [Trichonephila inaurata madagascariensis]